MGRGAQAEPSQRVTVELAFLVQFSTVTITAGVFLVNREFQSGAAGKAGDRFGAFEDCAMLRVSADGNRRRSPAALLGVAVDGVGDAKAGRFHVRQGMPELDLVGQHGLAQCGSLAGELSEEETAFGHQAGTAVR